MTHRNSSLASKYAQALLNSIFKSITYEQIGQIKNALEVLRSRKKALSFLALSHYNSQDLQNVLIAFLGKFKIDINIAPLVATLAKHKRLSLFPDVLDALITLYKQKHNICSCTIISAHILTHEQKERLTRLAERLFCRHAEVRFLVDEGLIAGIKIESNNRVWEYSVAKQLRAIHSVLKEVCGGN